MSFDLIPSTKALIPTEQIADTFVMFTRFNILTGMYDFKFPEDTVKRRYKFFLSQTAITAREVQLDVEEFTTMIKLMCWGEFVPSRFRAILFNYKQKGSINTKLISKLKETVNRYEKSKYKRRNGKKYEYIALISSKIYVAESVEVHKITFSEQLIAFFQHKQYNIKYINFLREFTRKGGEDFDVYIDNWIKRLLTDLKVEKDG